MLVGAYHVAGQSSRVGRERWPLKLDEVEAVRERIGSAPFGIRHFGRPAQKPKEGAAKPRGRKKLKVTVSIGVALAETAFVGDDVPDLPLLRHVGFAIAHQLNRLGPVHQPEFDLNIVLLRKQPP